jgi:hypothetical protein
MAARASATTEEFNYAKGRFEAFLPKAVMAERVYQIKTRLKERSVS